MTEHHFHVDLRGIIDLLANHLYSSPAVYVRELLQNAVDAIRARKRAESRHQGLIRMELTPGSDGVLATLLVADDGTGLTEDEIHRFVSTIGGSSKRGDLAEMRSDFLGQFGIGLLSGFLVAREIVMITRASRNDSPALEWRGREDGSYTVRELPGDLAPGTQVYLRAKAGREEWFEAETLKRLARRFGECLPISVRFEMNGREEVLSVPVPPWHVDSDGDAECERLFGFKPLDRILLRSAEGDVEGVAFVLPAATGIAGRTGHRVYLKGMLLSDREVELLPRWAFFARAVVNAHDLRPTASRESFYEDDKLVKARAALGRGLKRHLLRLAERDPERLRRIIGIHQLSMKALAVEDAEFFRVVGDWLPFDTSLGLLPMGDLRNRDGPILTTRTSEEFRQLAPIATAQGLCLVNGGLAYHRSLLARLAETSGEDAIRTLDPEELLRQFRPLSEGERDGFSSLMEAAGEALERFRCRVEVRRFSPDDLPALYVLSEDAAFLRSVESAKESADSLWSSILDRISRRERRRSEEGVLCLNAANPIVKRLASAGRAEVVDLAVETIYTQGLLLGHHPLRGDELALLSGHLLRLLELGLEGEGS